MAANSTITLREWLPKEKQKTRKRKSRQSQSTKKNKSSSIVSKKKLLRFLGALVVILVICMFCIWISKQWSLIFKVGHIEFDGNLNHYQSIQIEKVLEIYSGESFFQINIGEIKKTIVAFPWVKHVSVQRKWPSKVFLYIERQIPTAYWNDNEFMNDVGELYSVSFSELDDSIGILPRLYGIAGNEKLVSKMYTKFANILFLFDKKIKELYLDERNSWRLITADGMEIKLGTYHAEERLSKLAEVYITQLEKYDRGISSIDLRHSNGLAVEWSSDSNRNSGHNQAESLRGD